MKINQHIFKFIIVIVFLILNSSISFSQSLIQHDSLLVAKYKAKVEYFQGVDFDSTIYYLNKLEGLPLSNFDRGRMNLSLGNMFLLKGDLHLAMKYYLKVKEYGEINNDYLYEAAGVISVASVYLRKEEYAKSIESLTNVESKLLNYKPKNDTEKALITRFFISIGINKSLSLSELEEYGSATKYIEKSILLSDSINDTYNLAIAYSDKAKILQKIGKYDEATKLQYKALALREKDSLLVDITRSHNNLGSLYYDNGNKDSAYYFLSKGFQEAKKMDLVYNVFTTSKLLSELYASDNNFENAYKYLLSSYEYKGKYQDVEKMNKISDLNYKYKIKILNAERLSNERRLYATIGILLLIVVIAVLLYFLQRKTIEKDKIAKDKLILNKQLVEDKLEYKNKQLVTNVMHQISKNELIISVSQQLKELSADLNQKQKSNLNRIIRELTKGNDDSTLSEFELTFQDVHTKFYNKLDSLFSLTPSERRMAAFIRLNLSSKEISSITGQSVRTIDVTRYRLRKKLNINNTDTNLSSFLAKL